MRSFTTRRPQAPEIKFAAPPLRKPESERPDGPLPGDILLFTHAKGLTRLIPWFTGSRYYHVGVYEGNNCVLEARPEGVVRRNIKKGAPLPFRIVPMPREEAYRALGFIRLRLGRRYDPIDIAFIMMRHLFPLLQIHYSNHASFTCGELVVRAWRSGHCDLFPDRSAAEIIPADFSRFLPPDARDEVL